MIESYSRMYDCARSGSSSVWAQYAVMTLPLAALQTTCRPLYMYLWHHVPAAPKPVGGGTFVRVPLAMQSCT